jgi:hypothetical protein
MVTVKVNIKPVTDLLRSKLAKLSDKDYLLRPVAFDVIDLMTKRIHIDGKASDGGQIGTYSKGYLALRSGEFKNADRNKKGETKNSGTFTAKAAEVGKPRPNYHRGTDPKVIISLTRQLENDWSVIATQKGYGIGFLNLLNYQKSQWVQQTYKKKIFDMTASEKEYAIGRISELAGETLK